MPRASIHKPSGKSATLRTSPSRLKTGGTKFFNNRIKPISVMFNPRHALLLDESRFPIPRHWHRQATRFPRHCHDGGRGDFRYVSTLVPRHFRPVAGHIPNVFHPIPIMIPFNSIETNQAVTEVIPCRRQKFKALNAAKEIIAALRQKGASHSFVSE